MDCTFSTSEFIRPSLGTMIELMIGIVEQWFAFLTRRDHFMMLVSAIHRDHGGDCFSLPSHSGMFYRHMYLSN